MAQLEKIEINYKIGYKDKSGNIVIEPIYDDGQLFVGSGISEDDSMYASVLKDGKCGVIDIYGNVIVPFMYEEAYHLVDNLFAVRKKAEGTDWSFGVIDGQGTIIIPFEYKLIRHSHNFVQCIVSASSKKKYTHRYMDTSGRVYEYQPHKGGEIWYNTLGELVYKGEGITSTNDYLIVKENDKLGVIDSVGKYIIQCLYTEIYCTAKDRFVVRRDNESSRQFGVIDNCQNVIIGFDYKYISHENFAFYECFQDAQCELKHISFSSSKNEYSNFSEPIWYNKKGIKVFEGKAKILSDLYLAISSNDKWGVVSQSNKRIVNFLYDCISIIQDKLIVAKDSKIGVLDTDGSILITPSYNKIECVTIDDGTYGGVYGPLLYGKYNKECVFDSEDESKLLRIEISYEKLPNRHHISIENGPKFDFEKLFILFGDGYCELFSVKDGIIANSRYEEIRKLTRISFAVKRNNKWGVFRGDVGELIIPCEYDRFVFEGGHVVLLNKGDLWGAKSIVLQSHILYPILKVDVPIKYKEIKILDSAEALFGVKIERTKYDDSIIEEYTIVDKAGEIFGELSKISNLDKQCEIFHDNYDRILASQYGKYGFISSKGYVTIPFQFDCIEKREDGYFDVEINEAWGVLDISGREIVGIKYSKKIPFMFANAIVQNAFTGRYGILSENGIEKVPSIYEHLMIRDNLVFFGYNGYESGPNEGSFFSNVENAIWGVMDNSGNVLIPPKYDCYKIQDGFLLAGRDGSMLCHDESFYGSDYSGVYDLYTLGGEFLFGGIREFFYNKENELFVFFFGGEWETYSNLVDEWNNIYIHDYIFRRGIGLWLILDKNFKSIIRDSSGKQIAFEKGTTCKIEVEQHEKGKTYVYNMPISVMAKGFAEINGHNIIIGDSNNKEYRTYAALNVTNGEQTPFYQRIELIDKSTFFFAEGNKIGVRNYHEIIEDAVFMFMTYPVNGFYFVAKELDGEFSNVVLRSLYDSNFHMEAIKKIKTSDLIDKVAYGRLKIGHEDGEANIENVILPKHDIFDESFSCKVSKKQSDFFCSRFKDIYWFATDYRMKKKDYSGDYGDYDDHDYARDTWDAMTDGMYGDMPDGFDGDYSFLGY